MAIGSDAKGPKAGRRDHSLFLAVVKLMVGYGHPTMKLGIPQKLGHNSQVFMKTGNKHLGL